MTDDIERAAALLLRRLDAARAEQRRLLSEIADIEAALRSLPAEGSGITAALNRLTPPAPTPSRPVRRRRGPTVAAAVRKLLDSEPGPWTPASVRDALADRGVQGDRSDWEFREAIAIAMHTERKRGTAVFVADGDQRTISTKWLDAAGEQAS